MDTVLPPKPVIRETTISVMAARRKEIAADKVDLLVTIKGTSLITGSAALKKAKEVNQLITALLSIGVKEDEISLRDVRVESSNGVLTRTSAASYTLRVRCSNLELLGEIIGAISSQKTITVDHVAWRYPELKAMQMEWLESCIAEAKERAARISAALGVKLVALRSFTDVWKDSEETLTSERGYAARSREIQELTREAVDLGFSLSHSKTVEQRVDLVYVVNREELFNEQQPTGA